MRPYIDEPEFDVVVVGSGIAGALVAHRLAKAGVKVLILEAGGVAPESLGRWNMLHNYYTSPSKSPDSPFCGEDVLPVDPNTKPGAYRYVQPDPVSNGGNNYYFYADDPDPNNSNRFKSFFERMVGGSTWHWQGIYIRMLPNDFRMKSHYQFPGRKDGWYVEDWPISYADIEPWYVQAEYEMGVAGSDEENEEYYRRRFRAYRSRRFPMPALVPSYLDKVLAVAANGKTLEKFPGYPLKVNTVPHAINSRDFDGRPACDGHTSCVPLCPIKARYEAIVHVERAVKAGAILRSQCVVTQLELDADRKRVKRVKYKRWDGDEYWVSGRIVVLAANAIENPRILLLSEAANSSDAVGRYLMDHPIKQSYALSKKPLYPYRGPQTTSDIAVFRDGDFRRQFAGFKTSIKNDGWSSVSAIITTPRGASVPMPVPGKPYASGAILDYVENQKLFGADLRTTLHDHATRQITLNSACEQLPWPDNRVTLAMDKPDGFGIPRPQISYRVYDEKNYVSRSFDVILDLHALVFKQLGIPPEDQFPQKEPKFFGGSGHIMGTTVMGNDPKTSVVDKDCRTHDHANLFVLGSSVFPTSSTANPTSTIAALALRAAESIKSKLRTY
jgi:choline dehydrogenase-like flavoprotein